MNVSSAWVLKLVLQFRTEKLYQDKDFSIALFKCVNLSQKNVINSFVEYARIVA